MYAARVPRHVLCMGCRETHAVSLATAASRTPTKTTPAANAAVALLLSTTRDTNTAGSLNQFSTGQPSHLPVHHRARRRNWQSVSPLNRDGFSGGGGAAAVGCNSEATVMAGNRRQLVRGLASNLSALKVPAGVGRGAATGKVLRCMMSTSMPEREFHVVADGALEDIHDAVEGALEDGFDGDFDCNLAQGVLNIVVAERGTWVLNKQSPNRQIWWSSPVSGPKRFEYDEDSQRWLNSRDGITDLRSLLTSELKDTCGVDLEDFSQ